MENITDIPVLPENLKKFIQAEDVVLQAEITVDGRTTTVAQLAQDCRGWKAVARLNVGIAILVALVLGGATYWYNEHPVKGCDAQALDKNV